MATTVRRRLIDTPDLQVWTMTGLVIALVAIVIASVSLYRTHVALAQAQAEVLVLNKRVEDLARYHASEATSAAAAETAPGPTVITARRK